MDSGDIKSDASARTRRTLSGGRRPPARIDIKTASADDLDAVVALKGHGLEIVPYREERGRFTNLRQLDEVPGLAGKTDGVEDALTVGNAAE